MSLHQDLNNNSKYESIQFNNKYRCVPIQESVKLLNKQSDSLKNHINTLEVLYKLTFISQNDLKLLSPTLNISSLTDSYYLLNTTYIDNELIYSLSRNGFDLISNYTDSFFHNYNLDVYDSKLKSYNISTIKQNLKSSHFYVHNQEKIIDFISDFRSSQYPILNFDMVYELESEVLLIKYIDNITLVKSIRSICEFITNYYKLIHDCNNEFLIYANKPLKLVFTLDDEEIDLLRNALHYALEYYNIKVFYLSHYNTLIEL